jgi:hypothetical protein
MSCIYRQPVCNKTGTDCDSDDGCSAEYRGELAAQCGTQAATVAAGEPSAVQHGQLAIAAARALVGYYDEFGSDRGFDEQIDLLRLLLQKQA